VEVTVGVGEALDRDHLGAFGLGGEHGAGLHGAAVEVDGTGAALPGIAANVGAGQAEVLAQEFGEQGGGIDIGVYRAAVDGHRHVHSQHPLVVSLVLLRARFYGRV